MMKLLFPFYVIAVISYVILYKPTFVLVVFTLLYTDIVYLFLANKKRLLYTSIICFILKKEI